MDYNINAHITNNLTGYVADANNIKGGYAAVNSFSEIPDSVLTEGMLVFNKTLNNFYIYDGANWTTPSLGSPLYSEVTYAQFVSKITNSQLVSGMTYRITDYVTTCDGVYDLSVTGQTGAYLPYATSAEHPFDLIVEAISANTYNENVKAALHIGGDGYFDSNNINAWELKWTHLNDKTKYSWADTTNGKGVIYYMKDEFENEAFYDFKNIMNLQFALRRIDNTDPWGASFEYDANSLKLNRYGTIGDVFSVLQGGSISNNLEFDVGDLNGTSLINLLVFITDVRKSTLDSAMDWTYMLAGISQAMGQEVDLATLAYLLQIPQQTLEAMTERQVLQMFFNAEFYYTYDLYDYEGAAPGHLDYSLQGSRCQSNKIGHCSDVLTTYLTLNGISGITIINNGLPLMTFENYNDTNNNRIQLINYGNEFGMNSFLNVFGYDCYSNKAGDYLYSNRFGYECNNNIFGSNCFSNSFGNTLWFNTFGNLFTNNNFQGKAYDFSFGGSCRGNVFGTNCDANTFGGYCIDNTFGNLCHGNSFGNLCNNNTFGNECKANSLGNNCKYNTFGYSCNYNSFANDCNHNVLYDGCSNNYLKNDCDYNTFEQYNAYNSLGNRCHHNEFSKSYIRFNILDDGVNYVELTADANGNSNNLLKNVKICQGVAGSSGNVLTITATRNLDYQVAYKKTGSTEVLL